MGATIGMAMFGAIIFIPLYLQLVYGAERHGVGPAHAAADGRPARRRRRLGPRDQPHRPLPRLPDRRHGHDRRWACSCSRGSASAPRRWLSAFYMLVVGVGIGLVMQVLVLVVQNDAQPENIGVATSTATFFRSVGGAFGVAIFGAIFAARLARRARAPARRRRRRALGSGVQLSPAEADQLPPLIHAEFLDRLRATRCTACSCGALRSRSSPSCSRGSSRRCRCAPRSAQRATELGAEEAVAGSTPPEELVEPRARAART